MPILTQLRVDNFRNLRSLDLTPVPNINFIFGENGAGKTSLLEAISVIALGRSFRTRKFKRLIKQDEDDFTLFARARGDEEESAKHTIGIQRGTKDIFRIDGKDIHSSTELATLIPSLLINAHSFDLIEGSAKQRRMFFDWLVFHVKHEFGDCWKQYAKCLKQRNTLLRHDKIAYSQLEPWDIELAKISEQIKRLREYCFKLFNEGFDDSAKRLQLSKLNIELGFVHGWKQDASLMEQYQNNFERDKRLGYTNIGPHKAELKILVEGVPAIEILSRGQQKLLVSAFIMNQASIFNKVKREKPVFLIDDLPAELDETNLTIVSQWIHELDTQAFITAVDQHAAKIMCGKDLNSNELKMFHVKHGEFQQL